MFDPIERDRTIERMTIPKPDSAALPDRRRLILVLLGVAVISPLLFGLYSEQAWEDFFITLRHAVNLTEGKGLTYQEGERIQGFSTPLMAFLSAGASGLAGPLAVDTTLWLLRLVTISAFLGGLGFLLAALPFGGRGRLAWPLILAAALYALESKTVAFTINGMETALVLFFLAGTVWSLDRGGPRGWLRTGLFWGGLLWTRPDGAVFVALAGIAHLAFGGRGLGARARELLLAGLVGAAVYLPWLLFAWSYYGSPVPQTVIAKSALVGGFSGTEVIEKLRHLPDLTAWVVLPPYAQHNPAWSWLFFPGVALGAVAILGWILPRGGLPVRRTSFMAFGAAVYCCLVNAHYPWYFPPIFLLMIPTWSSGLAFFTRSDRLRQPLAGRVALGVAGIVLAGFVFLWIDYATLARAATEINERMNRRRIGLWLKANAAPDDRVYLECPGYIGFYCERKILDFPGLVSPEVTAVYRARGGDIVTVGLELAPEWLVLRPHEMDRFMTVGGEDFKSHYQIVRVFDQRARLLERVPRHRAAVFDSYFFVLRRNAAPSPGR